MTTETALVVINVAQLIGMVVVMVVAWRRLKRLRMRLGNQLDRYNTLYSFIHAGIGISVTCPECGGDDFDPILAREQIPGVCVLCANDKVVPLTIAYEFFRGVHGREHRSELYPKNPRGPHAPLGHS